MVFAEKIDCELIKLKNVSDIHNIDTANYDISASVLEFIRKACHLSCFEWLKN